MTDPFREAMSEHPMRPTHPDFERLREVVDIIENLKAGTHGWSKNYKLEAALREMFGVKPDTPNVKTILDRFFDVISAGYLAANRSGINAPADLVPAARHADLVELMTNGWMDGFLFGVLFQILGGHRDDPEDGPR